jgi:predicted nucleic acid-binding protein
VAAAFLLDANVLVALAWPEHEFHERVGRWFARHSRSGWATCPITQGAFVGILSNPAFSPDSIELTGTRLRGHQQITDAYLLGLALHHRGKLATMDEGTVAWGPDGAVELVA